MTYDIAYLAAGQRVEVRVEAADAASAVAAARGQVPHPSELLAVRMRPEAPASPAGAAAAA